MLVAAYSMTYELAARVRQRTDGGPAASNRIVNGPMAVKAQYPGPLDRPALSAASGRPPGRLQPMTTVSNSSKYLSRGLRPGALPENKPPTTQVPTTMAAVAKPRKGISLGYVTNRQHCTAKKPFHPALFEPKP
jgi:hypothetical protein